MAADQSPSPLPPSTSPLRIPIFRAVWTANLVSNFGTIIQSVGASWMMVSLSASAIHVALVQASTSLPIMLLALVAGAMADSMDRRLVMLAAQVLMLVASTALAIFAIYGHLTPWLLLAFTFLIGCGTALNGPAWQASVGDMVPRPALSGAIALNSVGFNIARSVGPAIGGAIVAAAGAGAAFFANAVSYLALIAVLVRWKPERPERRLPRESLGTAIGAGLRYVALSPNLRLTLGRSMLFGVAAASSSALMPLVARDMMAGGPLTYGLLLGAFGIGSVCGALGSGWLREHLTTEGIVRGATVTLGLGSVATALSPWLPLTMAALAFYGAGWVLALSSFNASVQLGSPRWVVARAISLYQMFAFGGMAVGSWGFGALAEAHGVANAMLVAAGLHGMGLIAGLLKPLPQSTSLNLDPLGRWTEPETVVPVEGRSGPVVVSIEYAILPGNSVAFLTVMDERRRIRLRDGARNWRLLRDLADERLWVERYQVPTWLDYVRHNERRTQADAATGSAIRALHEGPWPPVVHRMIERRTASVPSSDERATTDLSPPLTDPTRYS
ncbi:MAG TPA: MFS transporter [Sphingobium sp.]